jgi:hypothetical protein
MQTSDATWQAYNPYPGSANSSLYNGAVRVNHKRPMWTRGHSHAVESFFGGEYQMIRFLERNGYDVSYTTNVDTATRGSELLEHKAFLSVGHDEYWSKEMRDNVEAARAAGVNLAFLSGNEIYWKTRYENGGETLVCYKSSSDAKIRDPGSSVFTGTWRDPRFRTGADPVKPENGLTGTLFEVNGTKHRPLLVPYGESQLRQWRNSSVAQTQPCEVAVAAEKVLGAEWDIDADNGYRPPGLFHVSSTTHNRAPVAIGPAGLSAGSVENFGSGQSTHNMTMYRHPSGALVFSAGMEQFAWALDNHVGAQTFSGAVSADLKQFTVNLLADMGVQPQTLETGLAAATQSTDTSPPVSTISGPVSGSVVAYGSVVTVAGTAMDAGGRVSGVEVSTDGGTTWHPAQGREAWTYTWMATSAASVTLKSRAADDSGNIETPTAGVTLTVGCAGGCNLWGSAVPAATYIASAPVELGVKVRVDMPGTVSGLRFYRVAGDTGPHTAHLWLENNATPLATATFPAGLGWVTATFASPIPVQPDATYVASYHSPTGYRYTTSYLASGGTYVPPLRARAGVYAYGGPGTYPTTETQTNYWVDPIFTPAAPGARSLYFDSLASTARLFQTSPAGNELGIRFKSSTDAVVAGIRFFRDAANTDQQVVNLWGPAPPGTTPVGGAAALLASGTYLGTSVGWVTVPFSVPVAIKANVEYEASYFTRTGYSYTLNYFSSGAKLDAPLTAIDSAYNASGKTGYAGPAQNYLHSNYWVDVVLQPTAPQATSIWRDDVVPRAGVALAKDSTPLTVPPTPLNLGMRFVSSVDGLATGVRFYKHPTNTGLHEGSVWNDIAKTRVAFGTFAGETSCGWQTLTFSAPAAVSAGVPYIVSYSTTTSYSYEYDFFTPKLESNASPEVSWTGGASGIWSFPIRAVASNEAIAGAVGNGLFSTGAMTIPSSMYLASNYWVDVVFKTVHP